MSPLLNPRSNKTPPRMAWISFTFFIVVASANLFEAVWINPRFQQIYKDLGVPQDFILLHRSPLLILLAFLWVGIDAVAMVRFRGRKAMLWNLALIAVALGQSAFTFIALVVPLVDAQTSQLTSGMPENGITPAASSASANTTPPPLPPPAAPPPSPSAATTAAGPPLS